MSEESIKKVATKKRVSKAKKVNYEEAFTQLEQLVNSLEDTDLPLEEALKNFEKGIQLTNLCQKTLSEAEQKVQILMQDQANHLNSTDES